MSNALLMNTIVLLYSFGHIVKVFFNLIISKLTTSHNTKIFSYYDIWLKYNISTFPGTNRSGSLRSSTSNTSTSTNSSTGDSLCSEMSALMHDYETVSRMADLAASLRAPYPDLSPDVFKSLLQTIQQSIQVFKRSLYSYRLIAM